MALFRKFFYRKPPDGLLEISERVYVFDCCFTTDVLEEDEYKVYVGGIVAQLRDNFPDASFMVFNFREGETQSQISSILSEYDMTVMDYPRQYEGCPLLTMEMIHHFLRSSESWLSLGQQNLLLMHCERGGWPVLAFMLAALLVYRKQYAGEQRTLDMIYKQAPHELLHFLSPLNPLPSQLRYLHYISRRNVGAQWPPLDRALTLDCIILRFIPDFDGTGGCRPIFRIYGQDPFIASDRTPKVLFSTPKKSKLVRFYKQVILYVILSEMDAANSLTLLELTSGEEKEGLPIEAFAKVQEMFNNLDWLETKADAATKVLQQITSSKNLQEKLDAVSPQKLEADVMLKRSSTDVLHEKVQSGETNDRNKKPLPSSPKNLPFPLNRNDTAVIPLPPPPPCLSPGPGPVSATRAPPPPPPPQISSKPSGDISTRSPSAPPVPPPPLPPSSMKSVTALNSSGGRGTASEVPSQVGVPWVQNLTKFTCQCIVHESSSKKLFCHISNCPLIYLGSSRRLLLGIAFFDATMKTSDCLCLQIDLRRANNCEIMLTKVKMPLNDLMSSVLALDDSMLDVDQIDNLIKFCPTKEEMELLKVIICCEVPQFFNMDHFGIRWYVTCFCFYKFQGYHGDRENLGKCEQDLGRNADALTLYFGEDPARCPFEQVVSTLLNFVKMFARAHEENCKQLELEKKKARKEAEQEKVKNSRTKKEPQSIPP
ncbi:hypothetical protein BHM03_00034307 [Ensete ventricosum]|nr:hypothetical protein BHM03_00034307 [Ensete ventricosum]